MALKKEEITRVPLYGAQIEKALNRIQEKNPKADIGYLRNVPAYAIVVDGKVVNYIWLLLREDEKAMRICGAVSTDRNNVLTVAVLDHLIDSCRRAGLEKLYFSTSRAGMVKLSKKVGFGIDEVVMVARL